MGAAKSDQFIAVASVGFAMRLEGQLPHEALQIFEVVGFVANARALREAGV